MEITSFVWRPASVDIPRALDRTREDRSLDRRRSQASSGVFLESLLRRFKIVTTVTCNVAVSSYAVPNFLFTKNGLSRRNLACVAGGFVAERARARIPRNFLREMGRK